jgi:hypothetical protein
MAKKTFRDLLVKLNNVYSADVYIVNCLYVVAGTESDENNKGYYLCKLTPECIDICKATLDPDKVYFIDNIRKDKDDLDNSIHEVTDMDKINEVNDYIKRIDKYVSDAKTWDNFLFTDVSIKSIFSDGLSEDFFDKDDNIPTITLNKSLLPLVTATTADKLYYHFFVKDEYADLLIGYDYDYFTLYMIYRCMDLSK